MPSPSKLGSRSPAAAEAVAGSANASTASRGTTRAVLGMARRIPATPAAGYGARSLLFCERRRQLVARADPELAVGGAEVLLDGLAAHVQRLGDVGVRASLRRQRGDPSLVGRERLDSAQLRPARSRAGDQQLGPGALGQRRGAAADREIERAAE